MTDAGLAHFKGMPLMSLWFDDTGITDLTPLQGMPLEDIRLTPKNITKGLDILRAMKSLKTIGITLEQSWPAAEFWERYDKGEFTNSAAAGQTANVIHAPRAPAPLDVRGLPFACLSSSRRLS